MNLETLEQICMALKGTTQDIKWEKDFCFSISQKMYSVGGLLDPFTVSFKVPVDKFDELCNRNGIVPAPYLARHSWVLVEEVSELSQEEWVHYLSQSYQLVFQKLSKKRQREILEY